MQAVGRRPAGADISGSIGGELGESETHWRRLAKSWNDIGSPVRPASQDGALVGELINAASSLAKAAGDAPPRVLLLGVTPELALHPGIQDACLVAVEREPAMVNAVWPGNSPRRRVIRGDWLKAPFANASFDIAIGDGCLTALPECRDRKEFFSSIRRCLKPGGCLLLRLFCRPDSPDTPETVVGDLMSGRIGSIHAFKWRLAMAMQAAQGGMPVAVHDVWCHWRNSVAAHVDFGREMNWSPASVATMELYGNSPARLDFMRLDDALAECAVAGFRLLEIRHGDYELADRCPHVLLAHD